MNVLKTPLMLFSAVGSFGLLSSISAVADHCNKSECKSPKCEKTCSKVMKSKVFKCKASSPKTKIVKKIMMKSCKSECDTSKCRKHVIKIKQCNSPQCKHAKKEELNNKMYTAGSIDFKNEQGDVKWKSVNDSVMGGRSKGSSFETEAGNRMFSGDISLKNRGGFSSVRTSGGKYNLSNKKGVVVKVRGDGRRYYLTSRDGGNRRIAFWAPLQTKPSEWSTFKIPFSKFYATSFGREIPNLKLNTKNVTSFGLMLYDKKDGGFSIELESIKTY